MRAQALDMPDTPGRDRIIATPVTVYNQNNRTVHQIFGQIDRDRETESWWQQLAGQAIVGELSGKKLSSLAHTNSFWFAVAAFKPDTKIYQGAG